MRESGEMYLKIIYLLSNQNSKLKAIDIAKKMNFSKPSISRALSNLKAIGYIIIEDDSNIKLTTLGNKYALEIYNKFIVIKNYLQECLLLNEEEAIKNACSMEHIITDKCYLAMKKEMEVK